ncbi:MAG: acyl carrier protein [Bacteroidia bacterium]
MENKKITQENICNELISYVKNNITDNSISIESETPFNQIGLDSSSIIEIVLFIERKFSVVIPEGDLIPENLKSINALAKCTYKHL